jgi:hypothetical protein
MVLIGFLRYVGILFMVMFPIYIVFACGIMIISIGKVNWRHLTHHDWRGYWLVSTFQNRDTFADHFNLINLEWQHGVGVRWWSMGFALYWICIHNGWYYRWKFVFLQFHIMNNHFWNSTSTLDQFFPFVRWFYICPFPLYFLQVFQHEDFIVIFSKFSKWQGDLLGKTLFILTHFCGFHIIRIAHLTHVFLSVVDGMHIVGLVLDVMLAFLWVQKKLITLRFSTQLMKCVIWSPKILYLSISFLLGFITPNIGFVF